MKIVSIIPARGGSKGIPGKNIKLLAGKPLIAYTIDAAMRSRFIDRVIVSTEDDKIAEVAKKYGAEIVKRPAELAQDETKTAPVVGHAVSVIENEGYHPDIIVLLQPTSPLRDENIIDSAIEQLLKSGYDSIFTGFKLGQATPIWKKNHDKTFTALYDYHLRPRRQEEHLRGELYCENGALYAIRKEAFDKIQDFLGDNADIFVMGTDYPDIDTIEDLEKAEKLILKNRENKQQQGVATPC